VKPRSQHQDDHETEDDRFAALVAAEARGEPVSAGDSAFRRRYQESHPDAATEAELWSDLGALGAAAPPVTGAGMSDAELLARVLQSAGDPASPQTAPESRRKGPPNLRRRGVAVTFAAVALAATLMVAFAAELRDRLAPQAAIPPVAGTDAAPSVEPSPPPPPVQPEESPPSIAPAPHSRWEVPPDPRPSTPPAPPAPPSAHPETKPSEPRAASADELLRRAQDDLGAGRTTEAVDAYRELVARYPASAEARAALISLGRLALDQGHAEEALGHLDRYLRNPGPLDEEARYWRIEALRRLGKASAEAAAIEEFLGRHPASVHAERLRARAEAVRGN
jgi:tetratricopeptide (TPR) repeat protein